MEFVTLSAEKLEENSRTLAARIKNDFSPDAVVFIAKAGFPIAKVIAEECDAPMIGVCAVRKGNLFKKILSPVLRCLPEKLLFFLRRTELKSGVHAKNSERNVSFLCEGQNIEAARVLIVDDSADTGHSFCAVRQLVADRFPQAVIRTAALNVWQSSEERITVDYSIYRDTALKTPMSADSAEHRSFLKTYNDYLATLTENKSDKDLSQ